MSHSLRQWMVLGGLSLSLIVGRANPPATPQSKTAAQAEADSRAKASEALADCLLPPANSGPAEKNSPNSQEVAPELTTAETQGATAPKVGPPLPPAVANRFAIPGAAAVMQARSAGYHFSPAGGVGARDGIHTTASQFQDLISSEIDGVALRQYRPPANWAVPAMTNKFYLFVEADLSPAPLAAGWKIRGLKLKGTNWKWVDGPQAGAPSASFVIAITAGKFGPAANEVILDELVLDGPPGETNWRNAFARKVAVVPKPR